MRTLLAAVALAMVAPVAAAHAYCVGDCDRDAQVGINELTIGVRMALEGPDGFLCDRWYDLDASGGVDVAELIAAVGNALDGCRTCPLLTSAFSAPCRIPQASARCSAGPDPGLVLDGGFTLESDGRTVRVELLGVEPSAVWFGSVDTDARALIDGVETRFGTVAPAQGQLSIVNQPNGQSLMLRLFDPVVTVDECRVHTFHGVW